MKTNSVPQHPKLPALCAFLIALVCREVRTAGSLHKPRQEPQVSGTGLNTVFLLMLSSTSLDRVLLPGIGLNSRVHLLCFAFGALVCDSAVFYSRMSFS